jgi:dTDP-4-dehydrorhamnose reductase
MKKILVTGSNGLLGQKLTDKLRNHPDFELIATAKGIDRYPQKTGYTYDSLDIADEGNIQKVFGSHRPDYIIHTAAMTNVDACELDHAACLELNVKAVQNLVAAANNIGAHFIHLSTDFIFDGVDGPYDEKAIPKPLSFYGNSKLDAEKIVMNAKKWAILRTVLVYGLVADMSRSNIVLWAKNSLQDGKQINVVDDQYRTPTLAEDLAQGCILAVEKDARGIYNISGKDFMNIYELVNKVADYWQLDKSLIKRADSSSFTQPAKRPPVTGFVLDKAIKELGYKPHSFTEGLKVLDMQLKEFAAK